jgi:hypothetical protein
MEGRWVRREGRGYWRANEARKSKKDQRREVKKVGTREGRQRKGKEWEREG